MSARASVEVHIEELVLTGFDAAEGERIGDAVQSELARLLAAGDGRNASGGAREALHAETPAIVPGTGARATGHGIARAVYGALDA